MKPRTLILLVVAVLFGAAASVLTYDLTHRARHAHVAHDDEDPGLIP